MRTSLKILAICSTLVMLIVVPGLTAEAHRDGCHRWHSCPSDTGSYSCGDAGYECRYPTYEEYERGTVEDPTYEDYENGYDWPYTYSDDCPRGCLEGDADDSDSSGSYLEDVRDPEQNDYDSSSSDVDPNETVPTSQEASAFPWGWLLILGLGGSWIYSKVKKH